MDEVAKPTPVRVIRGLTSDDRLLLVLLVFLSVVVDMVESSARRSLTQVGGKYPARVV